MILSPPVGWTARLQAERTVPRDSRRALRNGSFKVRRWTESDRTAGAMASIAPGAASPYPTGIPHPSEPPTSSQPERWRLPWRRRQCQPSTGIRGFGEVRGWLIRRTRALVFGAPPPPWRPPRPLRGPPLPLYYHKGGTDVGVCPVSSTYSTLKSDHALTTTRKQAKPRKIFVESGASRLQKAAQ